MLLFAHFLWQLMQQDILYHVLVDRVCECPVWPVLGGRPEHWLLLPPSWRAGHMGRCCPVLSEIWRKLGKHQQYTRTVLHCRSCINQFIHIKLFLPVKLYLSLSFFIELYHTVCLLHLTIYMYMHEIIMAREFHNMWVSWFSLANTSRLIVVLCLLLDWWSKFDFFYVLWVVGSQQRIVWAFLLGQIKQ